MDGLVETRNKSLVAVHVESGQSSLQSSLSPVLAILNSRNNLRARGSAWITNSIHRMMSN